MRLSEHARVELLRAGVFDSDPVQAAALLAIVGVVDALAATGDISGAELAEPLAVLLRHGTLSELSDDPGEWADRREQTGRRLWQSRRNPDAFSEDGGDTYFLLQQRQQSSPDPAPTHQSLKVRGPSVRQLRRATPL